VVVKLLKHGGISMSSLGNNILLPEISTSTTNFIGSSHVYGSEKTLTTETYDSYTTGGDLFVTAEPASTPSNPTLIIAVGATPKILGEVTITGGGRTNSPNNAQFRAHHSHYYFHCYHEGDGDGYSFRNLEQDYSTSHGGGVNTFSHQTFHAGNTVPSGRRQYYYHFKFDFTGWQGHLLHLRFNIIKGANYTWLGYWE